MGEVSAKPEACQFGVQAPQKQPAQKSAASIGPVGTRIAVAGNCLMMLRQFIGSLLDQPDRPFVATKCDLIDEG